VPLPGADQAGSSAVLRIQALYDLVGSQFLKFSLRAYTRNDQAASLEAVPLAAKGDLGYFSLESLLQFTRKGASYLTRFFMPGIKLRDPKTGEKIDLLGLLRRRRRADMPVLAGGKPCCPRA